MQNGAAVPSRARGLGLLAVCAVAVAGCGGHRPARTIPAAPGTAAKIGKRAVIEAFASVGLQLHDPAPPASSPHLYEQVAMLTSVRPHDGWTVVAYVYPTRNQASASFDEDAGEWSASGIASAQDGNLVVVVVPRGHTLSRPAPVFAMPALVDEALRRLPRAG